MEFIIGKNNKTTLELQKKQKIMALILHTVSLERNKTPSVFIHISHMGNFLPEAEKKLNKTVVLPHVYLSQSNCSILLDPLYIFDRQLSLVFLMIQ